MDTPTGDKTNGHHQFKAELLSNQTNAHVKVKHVCVKHLPWTSEQQCVLEMFGLKNFGRKHPASNRGCHSRQQYMYMCNYKLT